MAWVERFTCDICGKLMGESESWWVAINESAPTTAPFVSQPVLKLLPWDNLQGHSAGSKHLCGASCAHTFLDRWMAEIHAAPEDSAARSFAS